MSRRPARGREGELLAELHYRIRGWRVLARNEWAGPYELDLVLRRGRTVVVCEVKQKRTDRFSDPLEMVDAEKRRRVARAADAWLARQPALEGLDVRFEVAAVRGRRVERVRVDPLDVPDAA